MPPRKKKVITKTGRTTALSEYFRARKVGLQKRKNLRRKLRAAGSSDPHNLKDPKVRAILEG